jgi:LmbE family N-acetylglucosaminyl deacetylase
MTIDDLSDKRIMVVVAHQDDESLYFGGLLSSLQAKIRIVSITKPMAGRSDTNTRIGSFKRVCAILGCEYALYDLSDHPAITDLSDTDDQRQIAKQYIDTEARMFHPDVVITHHSDGEANPEYPTGHAMHKLVSWAVASSIDKDKIIYCGLNSNHPDMVISYDVKKKKELIDCYLPNWSPIRYPFAYDQEKYVLSTNA